MSPWTRLVSSVIFPLHERLKGHDSVARRRALEESQWWAEERLERHRLERLRGMLAYAGRHVPYYRDLFRELAFDPATVASLEDLRRLPFLAKPVIRAHTEALKSDIAGPLRRYNTGGSSGEPLIFFMGRERISHDVAAKWRATRWWGVDIGDPEIVVWGSPIELGTQDRVRRVRDALLRSRLLPAFEMSQAKLDGFIDAIRAARPRMIFGYPSALAHIARHAEARGRRLDDLGIRVAFVTSEKLYDDQRSRIGRAFGCPVANGYGGRDAGFIAHECPAGGMHISAEDIIVEIVDASGQPVAPGHSGEIVVTHLATREFPFIRYRTGDVGALDDRPCPCGRGLPILKAIEGRTTDFVVAADGTVMHGLALIYILRDLPGIEAFKIVQESKERVLVKVVSQAPLGPQARAAIVEGFRSRLGRGVEVAIDEVADIPPGRSGKFRYVVSHVSV
ncbi:MAG: phenylacetate--CoA ligase family protein [Pseudomonadota bacterium]